MNKNKKELKADNSKKYFSEKLKIIFAVIVFILAGIYQYVSSKDTKSEYAERLNIVTHGIGNPNKISYRYPFYMSYSYHNVTPELIKTAINNANAQKNWQKVGKEHFAYDNVFAKYCDGHKGITFFHGVKDDGTEVPTVLRIKLTNTARDYCITHGEDVK